VFIGFTASASKAGQIRAGAGSGVENPKQRIMAGSWRLSAVQNEKSVMFRLALKTGRMMPEDAKTRSRRLQRRRRGEREGAHRRWEG